MANVLLTQKCIRSCPYCFASDYMDKSSPDDLLKWADLIYIADFFEISGEKHISLLGGEPSLHPYFTDFILYLVERKFRVNIFTSGVMSAKKLEECKRNLADIPSEGLSFVCNLNDPIKSKRTEVNKVEKFLEVFGTITTPGFNIYTEDFDLSFIIHYVNRFGMKRNLRLGLSHPLSSGYSENCITPQNVRNTIRKLVTFLPLLKKFKIRTGFDCGFLLCMFTDEELGKLFKMNNYDIKFTCGPALDIGTDMTVWSCFPLSNLQRKSIYDFNSLKEINSHFDDLHDKIRIESGGIFEECDTCEHRKDRICSGGCLSHILINLYKEAPIRFEEIYQ